MIKYDVSLSVDGKEYLTYTKCFKNHTPPDEDEYVYLEPAGDMRVLSRQLFIGHKSICWEVSLTPISDINDMIVSLKQLKVDWLANGWKLCN